jgi:hypothetical protein
MIQDLDLPFASSTHNGRGRASAHGDKTPERSCWELLAWAILEQAVDDLAVFARWGIVTTQGKCLPWPTQIKRRFKVGPKGDMQLYWQRVPRTIASSHGPNDHRQLRAWFLSDDAQTFCNLIGCNLPAREIFAATVKNHGGLKYVA